MCYTADAFLIIMHVFIVMQNIIKKNEEYEEIVNVMYLSIHFQKKITSKNHKTQQRPSCNNDDKLLKFRLKFFRMEKKNN